MRKETRVFAIATALMFLAVSGVYAEEEIGLVQKLWRKVFKKKETVERPAEKILPERVPAAEAPAEQIPAAKIPIEKIPPEEAPAKTPIKDEASKAVDMSGELGEEEVLSEAEAEGLTKEEIEDLKSLKSNLKREKEERELLESLKRMREAQRKPPSPPQAPR